jgi:hypothetical protein
MNIKSLTKGLKYRGEAEGKRQTYYVFEGQGYFFVVSFSKSKPDSGNFNIVETEAVEYAQKAFAGSKGITAKELHERSRKRRHIKSDLDALNILYVLVATKGAKTDNRYKSRALFFNIK